MRGKSSRRGLFASLGRDGTHEPPKITRRETRSFPFDVSRKTRGSRFRALDASFRGRKGHDLAGQEHTRVENRPLSETRSCSFANDYYRVTCDDKHRRRETFVGGYFKYRSRLEKFLSMILMERYDRNSGGLFPRGRG